MESAIALISFAAAVICLILREATKEVITHDLGIITRQEIVYNDIYVPFVVFGSIAAFISVIFLVVDIIMCRYSTVKVGAHYLTVYIGMGFPKVYVDGELTDKLTYGHYMETALPDGTVATISFGRSVFVPCHISFSNGHKSVDI